MPSNKPISYEVKEDGINELIEEKNNMVTMLREVSWNGRESHLEIRKWVEDAEKETPMKGVSFMTEEGPHNLTETLVKCGFGNTKNIIKQLSVRDDFDNSLINVIGKQKVSKAKSTPVIVNEDEYYDPKEIIS